MTDKERIMANVGMTVVLKDTANKQIDSCSGAVIIDGKGDCNSAWMRTSNRKIKSASKWSKRRIDKQIKKMGNSGGMNFYIRLLSFKYGRNNERLIVDFSKNNHSDETFNPLASITQEETDAILKTSIESLQNDSIVTYPRA